MSDIKKKKRRLARVDIVDGMVYVSYDDKPLKVILGKPLLPPPDQEDPTLLTTIDIKQYNHKEE